MHEVGQLTMMGPSSPWKHLEKRLGPGCPGRLVGDRSGVAFVSIQTTPGTDCGVEKG